MIQLAVFETDIGCVHGAHYFTSFLYRPEGHRGDLILTVSHVDFSLDASLLTIGKEPQKQS